MQKRYGAQTNESQTIQPNHSILPYLCLRRLHPTELSKIGVHRPILWGTYLSTSPYTSHIFHNGYQTCLQDYYVVLIVRIVTSHCQNCHAVAYVLSCHTVRLLCEVVARPGIRKVTCHSGRWRRRLTHWQVSVHFQYKLCTSDLIVSKPYGLMQAWTGNLAYRAFSRWCRQSSWAYAAGLFSLREW